MLTFISWRTCPPVPRSVKLWAHPANCSRHAQHAQGRAIHVAYTALLRVAPPSTRPGAQCLRLCRQTRPPPIPRSLRDIIACVNTVCLAIRTCNVGINWLLACHHSNHLPTSFSCAWGTGRPAGAHGGTGWPPLGGQGRDGLRTGGRDGRHTGRRVGRRTEGQGRELP